MSIPYDPLKEKEKPEPDSWMDHLGTLGQIENELLLHSSPTKGLAGKIVVKGNLPLCRV